jgi:hypothetical protein
MKSRQFTLGLMALILTAFLSFKTLAQCCVAPVNVTGETTLLYTQPPNPQPYASVTVYRWQRVQEAGCTTPVKYKLQTRPVGDSVWNTRIVTTAPDATFVEIRDTCYKFYYECRVTSKLRYQWRVQGICSATNKTAWVHGPTLGTLTATTVTTSSASDASSQAKFTVVAYPNPAAGELKLSGNLKAGGPVNVQIINSVGETVLRQNYNFNPGDFSTRIDVSKLPSGVYLVVVNDKNERTTLSIIKQ